MTYVKDEALVKEYVRLNATGKSTLRMRDRDTIVRVSVYRGPRCYGGLRAVQCTEEAKREQI